MAKPMFFYVGVYDGFLEADADYEAIKRLYKDGDIGTYDSAILSREPDGTTRVTKTEKPTQHGAWTGLAAGAAAAVVFPFLLPGLAVAGAGAGLGAWFGHIAHGTSREEAKEFGELLEMGEAALVVIGIDNDAERIEQEAARAKARVLKRGVGDWVEAEQEALVAIQRVERAAV